MYKEKEPFSRLTLESSYGTKQIAEWDHEDISIDDILDAFYGILIGATWHPQTILQAMQEFAEEKLEALGCKTTTNEE